MKNGKSRVKKPKKTRAREVDLTAVDRAVGAAAPWTAAREWEFYEKETSVMNYLDEVVATHEMCNQHLAVRALFWSFADRVYSNLGMNIFAELSPLLLDGAIVTNVLARFIRRNPNREELLAALEYELKWIHYGHTGRICWPGVMMKR